MNYFDAVSMYQELAEDLQYTELLCTTKKEILEDWAVKHGRAEIIECMDALVEGIDEKKEHCLSIGETALSILKRRKSDQTEEKLIRGFKWSNKAWYAEENGIKNGLVHFGIYSLEGGTTGEMCMEWIDLGGKNVPTLNVFNDAWENLAGFKDIIDVLGSLDGKNITDADFVEMLQDHDFTDLTSY
jgi:hypothetical protein